MSGIPITRFLNGETGWILLVKKHYFSSANSLHARILRKGESGSNNAGIGE